MYQGIKKLEDVIDYIEEHLTDEPDCGVMAGMMSLSLYEFRRIFAFLVGCPLSEYVRRRRLSLAACEIAMQEKVNLGHISEKYGYSTQAAFTRAFTEQHGVSPSVYKNSACEINLFTKPHLEWSVSGREQIPFTLLKEDSFVIVGFSAVSPLTDTCCCEAVWNAFYESGADRKINGDQIFAAYRNSDGEVLCTIGEQQPQKSDLPTHQAEQIPACHWACFCMNTADDDAVNRIYGKILGEWLPSAKLRRKEEIPTVEVYPVDMSQDGFSWEIRIPIESE